MYPPRILKAVFPIGFWQITVDKNLPTYANERLEYRPEINRASGSTVPTDIFVNPDYQNLSGVLYSRASVNSYNLLDMGADFVYIHNPLSRINRVQESYFNFGKEFIPKEDEEQYTIECRDHSLNKDGA